MYYYVINPVAGGGAVNAIQDKLRQRLAELGIDGEIAKTAGPGDATKMVRDAIERGFNTVVAVGGDGTLHEVINGITRDNVAVGVIPIGRGNLIASSLGIESWKEATEILAARRLTAYGLIAAGKRYFVSSITLGFEAEMSESDQNASNTSPKATLRTRIRALRNQYRRAGEFSPIQAILQVDNAYELRAPVFSMRISNLKFDNPQADNRLSISIIDRPDRVQRAGYLWNLLKKQDADVPNSTHITADDVVLETDPSVPLLIDGSTEAAHTPITIRLTNRRVRLITGKQAVSFKGA